MELMNAGAATAASVAAIVDVRSRRIPNWLSGAALLSGVLVHAWQDGASGILVALAGAGLGLAILLPLYAISAMGAGDVKLLTGIGALVGPQVLVSVALYALVVGGVMSLVVLAHRRRLLMFVHDVAVLHRPPTRSGATTPYAVAIALGVYLSFFLPSVLS
jgi:prepilin peptidase CpaA